MFFSKIQTQIHESIFQIFNPSLIALKITKNFSDHTLSWNMLGLIFESKNEFSKALKAYAEEAGNWNEENLDAYNSWLIFKKYLRYKEFKELRYKRS